MDVGTQLDYFRKEHGDFLRFLEEWDRTVELTASSEDAQCLRGLAKLREMQEGLEAIRHHCSSEERNIEERYRSFLEDGQLERLKADHHELARLVANLFSELRFATLYQTERARALGRQVSDFTRRHIQDEEKLLNRIESRLAEEAEERLLLRYTQSPE